MDRALEFLQSIDEDFVDEDYDEEDVEVDEDYDAQAKEMAQKLEDQLLADIAKAQLEAAAPTSGVVTVVRRPAADLKRKREAALTTMKAILAVAAKHAVVSSIIAGTVVPGHENALDILNHCVLTSSITRSQAQALSGVVTSLAQLDALFGGPRNSEAPVGQMETGKRKRDDDDDGGRDPFGQKRVAFDQPDLLLQVSAAVRAISTALTLPSNNGRPLDPSVVATIQYPLHHIFLFSVTSSPRASEGRHLALQELGGLVQMVGVLSGVSIGSNPAMPRPPHAPAWPLPQPPPDIGTAVYPCLVANCNKTFHRLYYLRTHQRLHTLVDRPFRCDQCPASFARNHDLKRHMKLHDRKAWRCAGCNKVFSRRDAIKRHKDHRTRPGGRPRGDADSQAFVCQYADVEEVEVEKFEGDEEASRRAKLWNGIAANQIAGGSNAVDQAGPEEGEVNPAVIQQSHTVVLQLLPLLQLEVAKALGTSPPPPAIPPQQIPPATLANIIALANEPTTATPRAAVEARSPSPGELITIASAEPSAPIAEPKTSSSLSLSSWLSEEQTRLLEQAIAQAASAAQAQAEAEAALEEEDEDEDSEGDEEDAADEG